MDKFCKKWHRLIKFNQKARLKSYIDMNTEPRKLSKNDFDFYNTVFGKTMENVRKHIYQTCNNRNKETFSVRTKLSKNNFFFGNVMSHTDKKNTDTHE